MDPLFAVRDFTIRGELSKIVRFNDEFRFPCTVDTAFRSKQGSLYPLEVLVYFLHHHQLKHTDYILSARRHGVSAVTLPDRKPLLDYLFGNVSSSESIQFAPADKYRPDDPHFHASGASLRFDLEAVPDDDDSRVRDSGDGEGEDLDVMAMILEGERPLRDQNSLLVCRNHNFFSVYATAMEREEKRKRMDSQQHKDGLVAKSRLMGAGEERGMGREEAGFDSGSKTKMLKTGKNCDGVPIILVPSASTTLICPKRY